MANRTDLRKFQQSLIDRLNASGAESTLNAKLGFQIGEEAWLVDLTGCSEVLPVPAMEPIPLARKWLAGVANVRGNLYTVVDMCAFLGNARMDVTPASRVLLLSPRVARGIALQVTSMFGLRHDGQFSADDSYTSGETPWIKAGYRDRNGRYWRELDPQQLVAQPSFLDISE
jgi:twitching motility protein PilI